MRRIFVPLHHPETAPALLHHAGLLAAECGAEIEAAFVPRTGVIDEAMAPEDQANADACHAVFERWRAASEPGSSAACWREIPDGAVYASASYGRASDLTITGSGRTPPGARDAGAADDRGLLRDTLLGSGRATLLLPAAADAARGLLEHVVIAWDGSAGAARAVGQSASLLPRARRLSAMIIGRNTLGERARQSAADYLRLHHPRMQFTVLDNTHRQTGRVLLEAMHREGTSLVVMGVSGRSHPMSSSTGPLAGLGGTILKVVEDGRIPILTAG